LSTAVVDVELWKSDVDDESAGDIYRPLTPIDI